MEADKSALLDSLSAKEKEIQRLKKELEENSKDKKELIGLRNFLYQAAEMRLENDTHEVDIKIMTELSEPKCSWNYSRRPSQLTKQIETASARMESLPARAKMSSPKHYKRRYCSNLFQSH